MVASLWLLVVLTIPDVQARNRPHTQDGEMHRGKKKKDGQGKTPFGSLSAIMQSPVYWQTGSDLLTTVNL